MRSSVVSLYGESRVTTFAEFRTTSRTSSPGTPFASDRPNPNIEPLTTDEMFGVGSIMPETKLVLVNWAVLTAISSNDTGAEYGGGLIHSDF